MQLHAEDTVNGPAFALFALDKLFVQMHVGNMDVVQPWPYLQFTSKNDLAKGHWIDLVIGIKYAVGPTGSVNIWRRDDGEVSFTNVFSIQNTSTMAYKNSDPTKLNHYWKTGYYRSIQTNITNILYLDGFYRASTFDDAVQACWITGNRNKMSTLIDGLNIAIANLQKPSVDIVAEVVDLNTRLDVIIKACNDAKVALAFVTPNVTSISTVVPALQANVALAQQIKDQL